MCERPVRTKPKLTHPNKDVSFTLARDGTTGFVQLYWPKIANFAHPLLFSALSRNGPFRIYGIALLILKLESSQQPMVKIW